MTRYFARIGLFGCIALFTAFATTPALAAVQISTKTTANMTCSQGVCTPTAKKAVLNVTDLADMLASGDVTVQSGSLARDLDIDAALSWASASRLTLDSYRAITFRKRLSVTGTGALTITTNDGGSGGDYLFLQKGRIDFWDVAGNFRLVINGKEYRLAKSLRQIAIAAKIVGNKIALAKDIEGRTTYNAAPIAKLSGSLEGLGHTISNLTISSNTDGASLGLIGTYSFNSLTDSARDLTLVNVIVMGSGFGQSAGVLAGTTDGPLLNIQATGSVSLTGMRSAGGGLVGSIVGHTVSRSSGDVAVFVGANGRAGGLVGTNDGDEFGDGVLSETFSTGAVSGGDGAEVGGLVGDNLSGTVSQSYALGTVTGGNNSFVGGLIGVNEDANTFPRIDQAYSTGAVSGGSGATLGGLLGSDVPDSSISSAYWDLDTSGIGDPGRGAGNIQNDHGIAGLTDAQLKSGLPGGFSPAIWGQNAGINSGYPYLIANPPPK